MTKEEQFKELQDIMKQGPQHYPSEALSSDDKVTKQHDFIVIDKSSEPQTDFDCYAKLE